MENNEVADKLFAYLKDTFMHKGKEELDIDALPEEFQKVGKGLVFLKECLDEYYEFAMAMARGEINKEPPSVENVIAAPLKAIQSDLRHLTWQTKQVANGDYGQKLDYLGEFSVAFNQMVDQLRERTEKLENMSRRDAMTGLYNHDYAYKHMERLAAEKKPFCVAYLDLDNLKYCNDTFGHLQGDAYIMTVVHYLRHLKTFGYTLFRMGGDEFLVVAENVTKEQLESEMERQREEMWKEQASRSSEIEYWYSFGCKEMQYEKEYTPARLMKDADVQMYQQKKQYKLTKSPKYAAYQDSRV